MIIHAKKYNNKNPVDPFLSIIIPTRNRINNLKTIILSLASQVDDRCRIIILDNSSDQYSQEDLDILMSSLNINYKLIRNKTNIGADANIMKCFEICETEWMFPLGDSKLIDKNCIKNIFNAINNYPQASFVNFHFPNPMHGKRENTIRVVSQADLLDSLDSFGNILLLGNTLYKYPKISGYIGQANQFISSRAAQFVIAFLSLQKRGLGVLSSDSVIGSMLDKPSLIESPSVIQCWLGFSSLKYLTSDKRISRKLSKLISGIDGRPTQPFTWLIYNTLKQYYLNKSNSNIISIYKSIVYEIYFETSIIRFIIYYLIIDFWLIVPFNGYLFNVFLKKIKNKSK